MPRSPIDVKILLILLLALLFAACPGEEPPPVNTGGAGADEADGPGEPANREIGVADLTIDYPLEGSVFPPDFTPPTILWHDDHSGVDAWIITVTFSDGGAPVTARSDGAPAPSRGIDLTVLGPTNEIYQGTPYQRSAHSFKPKDELWAEINRRSVGGPAVLTIEGIAQERPAKKLSKGEMTFTTSTDPVGAPIFFRDVPLMPAEGKDGTIAPLDPTAYNRIAWRLRDVSLPESKVILTGMPTCANCHSFSRDGKTLGMDVDGPQGDKGAYAIAPLEETTVIGKDEIITWNSFPGKPEGHKTIGFLSRVSPDGSYVLSTVNEALYVNNFKDYKFLQVFYPTRGILAYYNRETGEMKALPGADDTDYVHCGPVWFPDGKEIIFCRAKARDPYPEGQPRPTFSGDKNELEVKFELYRMPFNDGKGGTPVPVRGASGNGMSNTFPKISPDGKWLVYTKCRNGLLMRPDGRLWIVNLATGDAREMNCNTSLMNSWHSFSPNGRWMVFSSKVNTPYTQMFLTHIDEDGDDTPPILIPNNTLANRAVNIPEFVNRPFAAFNAIDVPAVDHHRKLQEGMILVREGRLEEALALLRQAVASEPDFTRAMIALGFALIEMGKGDEARAELQQVLDLDPKSGAAYNNIGLSFLREGKIDQAVANFRKAVEVEPTEYHAHANLGLAMFRLGKNDEALSSLRMAAQLSPSDPGVRNDLGYLLQRMGQWDAAIAEYRAAIEYGPDQLNAHANLAFALRERGHPEEAVVQYRRMIELSPGNPEAARCLSELLLELGRPGESVPYFEILVAASPDDPNRSLNLAWLLATLPDDQARDGARAIVLAEKVRATQGETAAILDVLAAAYAEAGRFEDAVRTAGRALRLQAQGQGTAAPGLEARAKAYQAGRPYRQ